jgi:addiction module HigA family antidote
MLPNIQKIKGIHPGVILKREIKLRRIKGKEFAKNSSIFPQTLSAILNERRDINPSLSIKLGKNLGVEEDYFMILQAMYDVKKAQEKTLKDENSFDFSTIRKVVFWDTDMSKIDWQKNKKAVVKRIFERGNDEEINSIVNFYGRKNIVLLLKDINPSFIPQFEVNKLRFLNNEI